MSRFHRLYRSGSMLERFPTIYINVFVLLTLFSFSVAGIVKPRPNDRNMPTQHIYRNIVGRNMLRTFRHPVATCCDVLGVVDSSLTNFKLEPTTPNMSQHIATRWPNAHSKLRPTILGDVALTCCDRVARALSKDQIVTSEKKFLSQAFPLRISQVNYKKRLKQLKYCLHVFLLGHPLFFLRLLSNAFSEFGSVGRKKKRKTQK